MPEVPEGTRNSRARTPAGAWRAHFVHYLRRPLLQAGPIAFASLIIAVIVGAFLQRGEGHLTAESGLGYWLGIAGAVIMLILVAYPFRKRLRALHGVGRVANWFRLHMILGIVGPTLVILHTNFNLGSLNSRLALFTMLTVVASGIVGRYLYAKVHKGLYGQQAELREIVGDISALKEALGYDVAGLPELVDELEGYALQAASKASVAAGVASALLSGPRTHLSRRRMLHTIKAAVAASPAWQSTSRRQRRGYIADVDHHLRVFFAAVRKAERLALFERLFSLWHHLHVPLFAMLSLTVVIHIIAVHRY